jgi:hypothetical protein
MSKTKHQILLKAFKRFSFPIDGIAKIRNGIVAIGDRTVDVTGCNYGYIRTGGISTYTEAERLVACSDPLYDVREQLFLNLLLPEGTDIDRYLTAAKAVLSSVSGVRIQAVEVNKETIQTLERIPASLNEVARISFFYEYQDVAPCETDICESISDIECEAPCEITTFCERVQGCISPVVFGECFEGEGTEADPIEIVPECLISGDEGNALTTGSDGKLYTTGGGGGDICTQLETCENFTDVRDTANSAVQPGDLASVATSGAYGDLSGTPSIPAAQIQSDWTQANNAALDFIKNKPTIPTAVSQLTNDSGFISIAALAPVAYFDGSAGHTGNTAETIVQVIAIQPSQWIAATRYFCNVRFERSGASVQLRAYLNTANTLNGNQFLIFHAVSASGTSGQFLRHVWKNGNTFRAANTITGVTDIAATISLQSATIDTSQVIYLILTCENSANAASSTFTNLHFGL